MRNAVCAVIEKDGKLLVISRGSDLNNWNLPGGKVEEGETLTDAIKREVFEETGLLIEPRLYPIFCDVCDGKETFNVFSYEVESFEGEIKSSCEGIVKWGTWDDILNPNCSFYEYNKQLCICLDDMKWMRAFELACKFFRFMKEMS